MRRVKGLSALCVFMVTLLMTALFTVAVFADISEEAGGTTILSLDFTDSGLTTNSANCKGLQLGTNIKYGGLTAGKSLDGNEYYKFFIDDTNVGTAPTDPFGGFYFSNRNNSKVDGTLKDHSYFTVDFDLSTDDNFVQGMNFFLCSRNESGSLKQANACLFKTVKNASGEWHFSNSSGNKSVPAGKTGTWHHFSFITMVDHSNGTNYSKTKTLVYIDGNYFETYTSIVNDGAYYFDTVRWGVPGNTIANHASVCFDNVLIRGYALGYQGPIASVISNTPATLSGNRDTIYFTDYETPVKPVVALNGKSYSSFEEAYAVADDRDTMKLFESIDQPVTIDRELLVDKNGCAFRFSTDLTVTTFGDTQDLLLFTVGSPTMNVTIKLPFEEYTDEYTWGDPIPLPETFSEVFGKNGLRYDFIDFSGSDGVRYSTDLGEVTMERLHTDVTFTANYTTAVILFETTCDNRTVYYTDFAELTSALFLAGKDVKLKFCDDYFAECGIFIPTDAAVIVDLNGYSLSSVDKVPLFILSQGSYLSLSDRAEEESVLSSESTIFYLYGDATVNVNSAKITLIAPTIADGVRSESSVHFKGCTVASSGAEIESIRLDGGELKMQNVTVIGDAEIHLNGKNASAELDSVRSVSGLPKEAWLFLTDGATANVISSAVCGNFVIPGETAAKFTTDCRVTDYRQEGYDADGGGLIEPVKEMFLLSFSPRVRADIPENEKLNGKKKNGDTPNLDLE